MTELGLSRAELKTWRRYIDGTMALLHALDRQLRDESGFSLDDFGVLRPLWASRDGAMRMGELAEQLSFSPSRLSHVVTRMEEKRWLTREPDPEDGRGKVVRLTDEGRAVFADIWPGHSRQIRELFLGNLDSEQRDTIEDVFAAIRRAAQHAGDCDPTLTGGA